MRYKTMLKRFVTEKKYRIKDRMMLIIRIKYDGMDIRKVAKSLGKSGLGGGGGTNGMQDTNKWALITLMTCHIPADRPK